MSGIFPPDLSAAGGLAGLVKSWRASWLSEVWPSSDALQSQAKRPDTPHPYSPVRVLVVDDNPLNLMVMSALLESKGLVPMLAKDGAEAVALACELHFDLILMDLQMPILDGLGATAAIRRFENTRSNTRSRPAVPIMAYSSLPPADHELAAIGLNGILPKPCGAQDLESCLVRWCPSYRSAKSKFDQVPAGALDRSVAHRESAP